LRLSRLAVAVVVLGGVAALVVWRGPSLDLLEGAFTAVFWEWVAAAVALNLVSVVVRAVAWRTVIDQAMPPPRPGFRSIFAAFSIGLLGNAALPGRIGELARVAVLANRLPRRGLWATLAGTVFAHRVFDLIVVIGLVLYVVAEAEIPSWVRTSLVALMALAGFLILVSIVSARRYHRSPLDGLGRVRRLVTMARQGLGVMHAPLPAAVAVFFQALGWLTQFFAVYAAMRAFRIDEPLVAAGVVLLVMNVATVFPLWPGNVGLMQAAVALALVPYGIAYAHGFAFGLGLQAIEASVGVGFGLAFLAREGLSFAMLRRIPVLDDEPAQEVRDRPRAGVPR
jgi:uncharacterized protein (TIRG00374 family)